MRRLLFAATFVFVLLLASPAAAHVCPPAGHDAPDRAAEAAYCRSVLDPTAVASLSQAQCANTVIPTDATWIPAVPARDGTCVNAVGDGTFQPFMGDDIGEVRLIVQDTTIEHVPGTLVLFGWIMGVSIALLLIVGVSMRLRGRVVRTAMSGVYDNNRAEGYGRASSAYHASGVPARRAKRKTRRGHL